jgi:UDP-glucuronate decarboxylase
MHPLDFSSVTGAHLAHSELDVVVTGGGGWLGLATLEMLESSLGEHFVSRVHVFASDRRTVRLRSGIGVDVSPLAELSKLSVGPHLLAHYAFATRELISRLGLADYVARNEEISQTVAGHVARTRPVGMVILSSGAVYLGDELATNPYGVLKARDERRFLDAVGEACKGEPAPRVVIPRLFNLSGPYLNKPSHYVLGSIIRDIGRGGPIELQATHPVVRSYVHVRDLVELAFAIMLGDGPTPIGPFDTAGEREIEVSQLAELAASVLGKPGIEIRRPSINDSTPDRYVGDSARIDSLCRAYQVEMRGLPRQIEDTAAFMGIDK